LKRYIDRVSYNRARVAAGYAIRPLSLHSVYLGNPGTGKTTVARLMGKAFNDLGLLTKGHVVVEERSSLTGKFYGTEEEKTNQALERARGGVLFIDEAYNLLVKDDPRDPGRRIIETLLTTLSDEQNRDICIIMAGYTQPMIDMLNDNPGLKSRLPNVYHFDDYTVNELMDIADRYLLTNRYAITDDARAALRRTVELAYNTRDHKFGNGRYIISLLENEVIQNLASRLVAADALNRANSIAIIEKADIPDIVAFVLKEGLGDTVTGTNFTY
jgi:SpoVK/Ycf46/Vps4 family AAA+-type ATPase